MCAHPRNAAVESTSTEAQGRKFFMTGLLNRFSRFPSACAREAVPAEALGDRGAGCIEKRSRISSTITCLTDFSEICARSFGKIRNFFDLVPKKTGGRRRSSGSYSTDAKADVSDGFAAEALLEFSQDFGLRDLFELVVQCGLEDADIEDAFA